MNETECKIEVTREPGDDRRMAGKVVFDPRKGSLLIDGEEFPYHISQDGISFSSSSITVTTMTLTLPVSEVEVLAWNKAREIVAAIAEYEGRDNA